MQIFKIISIMLSKGDYKAVELCLSVLNAAQDYVSVVFKMETTLICSSLEDPAKSDLRAYMDKNRSMVHNVLIDSINIANRYLFSKYRDEIPAGGIYPDPNHIANKDRRAIGNWAGELVMAIFKARA